ARCRRAAVRRARPAPARRGRRPPGWSNSACSSGPLAAGDPHALGQLTTERVASAVDLHHHGAAERLLAAHANQSARLNLPLGQVAEHLGVAVGDPREDALLAGLELAEANRVIGADR